MLRRKRSSTAVWLLLAICGCAWAQLGVIASAEEPAAGGSGTKDESPAVEVAPVEAAKPVPGEPVSGDSTVEAAGSLVTRQDAVTLRFKRFEKTIREMAVYMQKTDPGRAELLRRALGLSTEDRIPQQMELIVTMLEKGQFGDAIGRQDELVLSLKELLLLLQSEDRKSEIEKEKERIKDLLKDLVRVISIEKDVRAATERGGDPKSLIPRQGEVADSAGKLVEKIDRQDAEKNAESQSKQAGGQPKEGKSGEGEAEQPSSDDQPNDGKQGEGKQGEGKQGEGKQGEGNQGEGQQGEGQQGEGQQGEGQPSESEESQRTPGREEIEQARRDMERAIEELKRQDHGKASGAQDEALTKLQQAREKLEEILRQLREEERELFLAALEARFRKMLEQEQLIYSGTTSLAGTSKEEWASRHFSRARELSSQQDEQALEAAKALTLLKEEGSSVAFPEAVEQLQSDMHSVARLLERSEAGELTQAIELDIIEALEEMITALQKEMEKLKEQQQNQQQQQQGQPQDPPLVDQIAELKMLRSLQMQVNRRTRQFGNLVRGDQATDEEVVTQLRELSRRQARIQEATYNLATGKNK